MTYGLLLTIGLAAPPCRMRVHVPTLTHRRVSHACVAEPAVCSLIELLNGPPARPPSCMATSPQAQARVRPSAPAMQERALGVQPARARRAKPATSAGGVSAVPAPGHAG